MTKILQTIQVKQQIRDNEIKQADLELEEEGKTQIITKKEHQPVTPKMDSFFRQVDDDKEQVEQEKRIVLRDGQIQKRPKGDT